MKTYDTVALHHYWGLRRLDSTGQNAAWLAVGIFIASWGILAAVNLAGATVFSTPTLRWLFPTLLTVFPAIWIALARGAQSDFDTLESMGLTEKHLYAQFVVCHRRSIRLLECAIGGLVGVFVYLMGRSMERSEELNLTLEGVFDEFIASVTVLDMNIIIELVLFGAVGVCMVRNATFLYRQVALFSRIARDLNVDLLNIEALGEFANQPLRTLIGTMVFMSAMLLLLNSGEAFTLQYFFLGVPIQIFMLSLTLFVSKPMWQVRNKIRQSKHEELAKVRAAINGKPNALAGSCIESRQDDFTLPDLLYYEDRINAVWEWPLSTHVRRLFFYLVLPLVAWSLAALVENAIDTLIQ